MIHQKDNDTRLIGNRVLVIGGVSFDTIIYLDRFPEPHPHTLFSRGGHETIGSTGAGKALNLAALNFEVTCHALLGADEPGDKVRSYLKNKGIRVLADIDPQGTERHLNLMDEKGGRISIYFAYASSNPVVNESAIFEILPTQGVVVLNINNYCRRLIPTIRAAGKKLWCDIHDWDGRNEYHRDFVAAADYLFFSSDAMPDYNTFMNQMINEGKQLVVCTHGRRGSTALTPGGPWIELPVLDCYQRIDTNGAGDAFFSGYLYGHTKGCPPLQCLQLATIVAGLCVTSKELAYPDLTSELLEIEFRKHYGG